MAKIWQCGRFVLNLQEPKIMGVLNCTPDSFSDGGKFIHADDALRQAEKMIAEGADIIDVGAESTRPGAAAVPVEEEIRRLTPVVKALVADARVPISIDSKNTATMRAMLELGADIINDVHGLEDAGAVQAVADSHCGLCIMHMRGMPANMQDNTYYEDVVDEINRYLEQRVAACLAAGIEAQRISIDPGFCFGKTPAQNMTLIKHGAEFLAGRYPLLIGVSRKSTIGYYLDNRPVAERLIGSVTLGALSAWLGADIVRVHDVKETADALKILLALKIAE